ncbi:RidA family protein [Chitinophaga alhagiae]|uniref:RidA family protein n=1 Tax=Chitinophaga alhagiae TaxID=2203219 RepID=UPI000E5AB154|nr:RidA family protein [Chitinophaga alhagiae]
MSLMIQEIFHPAKKVSTGAYSAGLLIDGWLFVSGQGPVDLSTGGILRGSIEEETAATLNNIKKIVEEAGGRMEDIVKCTVHLSDIVDFDRYDVAYASFFSAVKPARTTVQSVLSDGIKIEIDAIAKIKAK